MATITAHRIRLYKQYLIPPLFVFVVLLGLWPSALLAQGADQQVLNAINQARAENGLAPLAANPLLNQAAQNHVNDMLTNYVYGHYGSDGSTVQTRVARTGYSATPWVSENWVSAGDASGAMRWWMNDYIHRVNILTGRWAEIGIGVGTRGSEMIFVTVFSAGGGSGSDGAAIAVEAPPQEEAPPPSVHIEQVSVPAEGLDYSVQGGDTLLAIGLRYGLPWERIAEANGLSARSLLQIGQTVKIPGSASPATPPIEVETEEYTVQPDDTLFRIAARRGMYWDEVAAVNGFGEHTILQIGQVIKVPVMEETPASQEVQPVENPASVVVTTTGQQMMGPVQVTADDFSHNAPMQFDVEQSWQATDAQRAKTTGGIGGRVAEDPQVAMIQYDPTVAYATNAKQDAPLSFESALYTVQEGDTIISIAVEFELDWGQLLAINGMDENSLLQPGQMIRLR